MLEVQGGQGTDLRGTLPLVKPIKHPRLSTAFLLVCAIGAPMTAATMNTAYCINSSSISFACTVTNTGPNSQQAESSAACDWGTGRGNINAFAAANWFTGYPGLRTSYGWVGGLPIDDVFAGHMWAQAHTEWVVTGGTGTGQMEVDYSLAMSNWGSVHASTSFGPLQAWPSPFNTAAVPFQFGIPFSLDMETTTSAVLARAAIMGMVLYS